jgi:LCP family protein required for cell wall assembly
LYAKVPNLDYVSKINTIYQLELNDQTKNTDEKMQPLLATVKDITALDIDYYVVLNFSGFRQAIDNIGGVNITSDRDLYDAHYPGPHYSYETFSLSKGFHHLDGATALQYARERHDDPQGDFGRALRQQQIMQAAKNKIFSAATFFNPLALNSLLDTLGDNVVTNISPDEIGSFLELSKKLDTQNITNVVLDAWNKDSLLQIVHVPVADTSFSALVPRVGNYSETRDLAQNIFDLDALKRKRAEIANEGANIAIINQSGNSIITSRIQKLLSENLDYKNVTVLNIPNKPLSDASTVYDLTDGTKPFTANELVTKLPAAIAYGSNIPYPTSQGSKQFDIVVVLGKDLVAKYTMEQGTIGDLNNDRDTQDSQGFNNN